MRLTTRLLLPPLLLAALAGCSEAEQKLDSAASGTAKARDCVALANDVAASRLGSDGQLDAQDAGRAAKDLSGRVGQIQDKTLRDLATELQSALQQAASATPADLAAAQDRALQAARRAADECGIPLAQFTG